MIDKINTFCTPIWNFSIADSMANSAEIAMEIEKKEKEVIKSNVGGYQSPNIPMESYFPSIYKALMPNLENIEKDIGFNFKVANTWLNINRKNEFNKAHVHPGFALSAVCYLQVNDDSGNIVFENPTAAKYFPIPDTIDPFFGVYWLKPVTGGVFVFPSYLEHYVEPNKSSIDRISIAFNLKKI
jgi:uncharacterized protein (TIGR02466 family)